LLSRFARLSFCLVKLCNLGRTFIESVQSRRPALSEKRVVFRLFREIHRSYCDTFVSNSLPVSALVSLASVCTRPQTNPLIQPNTVTSRSNSLQTPYFAPTVPQSISVVRHNAPIHWPRIHVSLWHSPNSLAFSASLWQHHFLHSKAVSAAQRL